MHGKSADGARAVGAVILSSAIHGAGCTAASSTSSGDESSVADGAPGRRCRTRTISPPSSASAARSSARRSRCCRPRDSSRCVRRPGTRVRPRRAWHLLDADVVGWLYADLERGDELGDLRELHEVRSTIEAAAARLAADRRTDEQLAEIEANERRVEAAWAEPVARREADLDFHGAVVGGRRQQPARSRRRPDPQWPWRPAPERRRTVTARRPTGRGVAGTTSPERSAPATAEASEAAMRALVEHDWKRITKEN